MEQDQHHIDQESHAGPNREGERPCPVCGRKMIVASHFHLDVDVCRQHGMWFDKDELLALADTVAVKKRREDVRSQPPDIRSAWALDGILEFAYWFSFIP